MGAVAATDAVAHDLARVGRNAAALIQASAMVFTPVRLLRGEGHGAAFAARRVRSGRAPGNWGSHVAFLDHGSADVVRVDNAVTSSGWANAMRGDEGGICLARVISAEGRLLPVAQIEALLRPEGDAFGVDAAQGLGQVCSFC